MAATTEDEAVSMGILDKLFDSLLRNGTKQNVHRQLWDAMNSGDLRSNCCDALHFNPKLAKKQANGFLPDSQMKRMWRMQDKLGDQSPHAFAVKLTPITPEDPRDGYLLTVKLGNKSVFNQGVIPCPNPASTDKVDKLDRVRFLTTAAHVFALTVKFSSETERVTEQQAREFIELVGGVQEVKSSRITQILELVTVGEQTLTQYVNIVTNSM
ncbi:hypothetical protein D5R81_16930 [Parashewanella spongiae]|uniref:Uncharacterized protein n=2 Tax=Parashewanella spongiae TaxID=342950 RepID=A0A3A6TQJ0_9GAMM|nr:hypothetical protein D5R81_16930 [Parashewanella spongiae]